MFFWLAAAIVAYLAARSGHRQLSHLVHWTLIGSFGGLVFALLTQDFQRHFWLRIQAQCSSGFALEASRVCLAMTGFAPLAGTLAGAICAFAIAFVMRRESQRPSAIVRGCATAGRIAGRFFRYQRHPRPRASNREQEGIIRLRLCHKRRVSLLSLGMGPAINPPSVPPDAFGHLNVRKRHLPGVPVSVHHAGITDVQPHHRHRRVLGQALGQPVNRLTMTHRHHITGPQNSGSHFNSFHARQPTAQPRTNTGGGCFFPSQERMVPAIKIDCALIRPNTFGQ